MRNWKNVILVCASISSLLAGSSALGQQDNGKTGSAFDKEAQSTCLRKNSTLRKANMNDESQQQFPVGRLFVESNLSSEIDSALLRIDENKRDGFLRFKRAVSALALSSASALPSAYPPPSGDLLAREAHDYQFDQFAVAKPSVNSVQLNPSASSGRPQHRRK